MMLPLVGCCSGMELPQVHGNSAAGVARCAEACFRFQWLWRARRHALLALAAGPACSQSRPIHICQQRLWRQILSATQPVSGAAEHSRSWHVGHILQACQLRWCHDLPCLQRSDDDQILGLADTQALTCFAENILQILRLVETIFTTNTAGLTYLDRAQMWTIGAAK